MKKILLAVCLLSIFSVSARAETREPFVFYHAVSPWNGYPVDKNVSGWNVVLMGKVSRGANTGVMAFLMKWDAQKQCWGMDRDCRNPNWAKNQGLSYVGPVNASYLSVEVKQ